MYHEAFSIWCFLRVHLLRGAQCSVSTPTCNHSGYVFVTKEALQEMNDVGTENFRLSNSGQDLVDVGHYLLEALQGQSSGLLTCKSSALNFTFYLDFRRNQLGAGKIGFFPPLTLMPCDSGRDNQLRVKSPPMIVIIN